MTACSVLLGSVLVLASSQPLDDGASVSLRKEALVGVSLSFADVDGKTFARSYDVRVAP